VCVINTAARELLGLWLFLFFDLCFRHFHHPKFSFGFRTDFQMSFKITQYQDTEDGCGSDLGTRTDFLEVWSLGRPSLLALSGTFLKFFS
jgi:hypothetical protein